MPEATGDARGRLVAGTADMLRRRGLNAASVREVAKHAGAPLGSTYHYFPGGKYQLAAEAVRWADDLTARALSDAMAAGPREGLRQFLGMWREILVDSEFRAGCPVLAVCVEDVPDDGSAPREAAVFAFSNWVSILAAALRDHGAGRDDAMGTATLIVAAVEGAVAMCRAERSTDPLDRVGERLQQMLDEPT
ncbi:TetR/AcrR family transcriptional regulator [Mycolicibacterium mageritense]|uniref:HTH-type transcriptional regulator n=1 Tax=Mycolicibacterium mageritense TaxID=53462 RepID=A0AAI8TV13_MYCME|nr:TetR/AcrR family transcriptional regulator [Mycolicibacterium mageritense]TXI66077.1 MAG: TetR/AcrR family transcriptional regulator [Mycolicibacterium mageritense]BDY29057.1 putative HTH-type transcriptional regulator [Mycolicibacterium mageritense]